MQSNINVIKAPRGKINPASAMDILSSFSDETLYSATMDIIFSIDLTKKQDYISFIEDLFKLIKDPGVKTRLEQSLIEQIKLLQNRKPKDQVKEYDVAEIFDTDPSKLENISSDLKLQLDITNYILEFYKRNEFLAVEKMLDVLLEKKVLLNTVKNFIKKEIEYFIQNQDIDNIKRVANKYVSNAELGELIRELLKNYLEQKKSAS